MRFWQDSQTWGAAFPAALREFAAYEADAVALWTFEHVLVPGLLQTEEYARAVLERHPHVTSEQVTERVRRDSRGRPCWTATSRPCSGCCWTNRCCTAR